MYLKFKYVSIFSIEKRKHNKKRCAIGEFCIIFFQIATCFAHTAKAVAILHILKNKNILLFIK
jgi:hypothetical protein